jgi:hypothetical protein
MGLTQSAGGLNRLFNSRSARNLSTVSMIVEAGLALARGKRKIAARLRGAAALASRWSVVGILAEIAIRFYQWRR